jgi:cobalt-zinc-cadmium efflux system membrane fusion protein
MKIKTVTMLFCVIAVMVITLNTHVQSNENEHHHTDHQKHETHEEHEDEHSDYIKLTEKERQEFGIKLELVSKGTLLKQVLFPAEVNIHLDRLAHVKPRYAGVVKKIYHHIGDKVQKGAVLAIVESNESLTRYKIQAPISGTIVEKHFTLGESVEENANGFSIADLSQVWITFSIYQDYMNKIKEGQSSTISTEDNRYQTKGRISYVSSVIDPHTRALTGRVVLKNTRHVLWKPGMFVNVRVNFDEIAGNMVIPKSALQRVEGKTAVFVQTPEGFEPHFVTLGEEDASHVIVLNGLTIGDKIATNGSFMLKAELEKESFGDGHAH